MPNMRFRLSLRAMFVLMTVAGLILARQLGHWRDSQYDVRHYVVGHNACIAMVKEHWRARPEVLHLVCYADGPQTFGSATAWPRYAHDTDLHPHGLFVEGERVPGSTDGHIWVCDNSSGKSVLMRVNLGEYEDLDWQAKLVDSPKKSFITFTNDPAATRMWKERVQPLLDLFTLRYKLAWDVFGTSHFVGIPDEHHDELLGPEYGDDLGAVISVEDVPSPEELVRKFRSIKEAKAGKQYRWNGKRFVEQANDEDATASTNGPDKENGTEGHFR